MSEPATVSVVVSDDAGGVVRSLLVDAVEDQSVSVVWDGLDDFGVLVPDGTTRRRCGRPGRTLTLTLSVNADVYTAEVTGRRLLLIWTAD